MRSFGFPVLSCFFLLCMMARYADANDGPIESVPVGGIQFKQSDVISMVKEDLTISKEKIRVAYVFRNTSDEDVTTMVAFPLPIWRIDNYEFTEPSYVDFTVKVNGKSVDFETRTRAVLFDDSKKGPFLYSKGPASVKKDVTDLLVKHGIELREGEKAWERINDLDKDAQDELIAKGVITERETSPGIEDEDLIWPLWGVQVAYLWEQTFPADAETRVEHAYTPQVGFFNERDLEPFRTKAENGELDWDSAPILGTEAFIKDNRDFMNYFEIDEGVLKWAAKQRKAGKRFYYSVVDYVLTTGAFWHGPIKDFTLTIEKPRDEVNVISTAIKGLKKLDDWRFQVKESNYTPDRDLAILFICPIDME